MGTETLENKVQMPGLGEMFDSEVNAGPKYTKHITAFIENLEVPLTKDKKPDISQLIEQLTDFAKKEAGAHFKDGNDPQWIPSYPALQNLFETYGNIVEGGKIRKEVRDAILNAYDTAVQNYTIARAQGRVQTSPVEKGKEFGEDLIARTSNKALTPLIRGAESVEKIAARISQLLSDWYGKVKQGYALHGNLNYLKPAYKTA